MTAVPAANRSFVDTNVWLYALISGQDPTKAQRARLLLQQSPNIAISTQVINEVCVNLIRRENFTSAQTRDVINDFYATYTVIELDQIALVRATSLRERYMLSYWDSLIVACALLSGASILHSEDMQDGLVVDQQVTIINPFT